jgi:hypothetical protein
MTFRFSCTDRRTSRNSNTGRTGFTTHRERKTKERESGREEREKETERETQREIGGENEDRD